MKNHSYLQRFGEVGKGAFGGESESEAQANRRCEDQKISLCELDPC